VKKTAKSQKKKEPVIENPIEYLKSRFPEFKFVFTFQPGMGFGDIALLTK
jgi:hypothetical protein